MIWLRRLSPLVALVLGGCMLPGDPSDFDEPAPRPMPSVTQPPRTIDETAFWAMIENARLRGDGDPDRIAAALDYQLYDANDETLRSFQAQLVAASTELYTWRHGEAGEMICGGMAEEDFESWRVWVIAQGRDVFDQVVANPDNVADVQALSDGCDDWFEPVGWAASDIWSQRHPGGYAGDFPDLAETGDPAGVRLHGKDAIRAALPRLAART